MSYGDSCAFYGTENNHTLWSWLHSEVTSLYSGSTLGRYLYWTSVLHCLVDHHHCESQRERERAVTNSYRYTVHAYITSSQTEVHKFIQEVTTDVTLQKKLCPNWLQEGKSHHVQHWSREGTNGGERGGIGEDRRSEGF